MSERGTGRGIKETWEKNMRSWASGDVGWGGGGQMPLESQNLKKLHGNTHGWGEFDTSHPPPCIFFCERPCVRCLQGRN